MLRFLLFCALVLSVPLNALALYYTPESVIDRITSADTIVVGVISRVDPDAIEVKVQDLVVGSCKVGDTIRVVKFGDWACAFRWKPYAVDQRLFMFLNKESTQTGDLYRIRGAGGEGESPIVDELIYPNFSIPGLAVTETPSLRLDLFRTAIADFRATFRVTRVEPKPRENGIELQYSRIDRVSTPTTASSTFRKRYPPGVKPVEIAFENRSWFHRILADMVRAEQKRIDDARSKPAKG